MHAASINGSLEGSVRFRALRRAVRGGGNPRGGTRATSVRPALQHLVRTKWLQAGRGGMVRSGLEGARDVRWTRNLAGSARQERIVRGTAALGRWKFRI